jgi:DNA uptake protein ComE-like DNA-binding protein
MTSRRLASPGPGFFACMVLLLLMVHPSSSAAMGWPDVRVRILPDSSFALVEHSKGGGKIRHCPFKDANGEVDYEQLVYVLGILDEESWAEPQNEAVARRNLESYYDPFIQKIRQEGLDEPIDINEAMLTQLVALPRIGPVLAVRIARKRAELGGFDAVEQLKTVKGIGQGTFNGLKFYVQIRSTSQ